MIRLRQTLNLKEHLRPGSHVEARALSVRSLRVATRRDVMGSYLFASSSFGRK